MDRATPPRLRALAALPYVLALAAHVLLLAAWSDRLPARLAIHFSAAGPADGWTGRTGYVLGSTALLLALGAGWTLLVRRRLLPAAWATAGFTAALLVQLLRANLDGPDGTPDLPLLAALALGLAAAACAGLAGWALTGLVPEEPHPGSPARHAGAAGPAGEAEPRLPLGDGELAGWTRDTASRPLTLLAVVLLLAAPAPLLLDRPPAAVAVVVAAIAVAVAVPGLALARVRVTVDRRGLTVRSSLLPRPRVRVPLDRVEGASARDVSALADFGGWGYRMRAHRTGVVLRSGEALVVRRDGGREFAVTVPDARTAAALLNTLAERHGKV